MEKLCHETAEEAALLIFGQKNNRRFPHVSSKAKRFFGHIWTKRVSLIIRWQHCNSTLSRQSEIEMKADHFLFEHAMSRLSDSNSSGDIKG